jgi:hypothetical protein
MSRLFVPLAALLLMTGAERARASLAVRISATSAPQVNGTETHAAATPASSTEDQKAVSSGSEEQAAEFESLSSAFNKAQTAYFEPYSKAQADEERAKIQLDPELHPVKIYTPKFQDLAKRAEGTGVGLKCWLWIVKHSDGSGSKSAPQAIQALTSRYLDSEDLVDLASYLRYASWSIGKELTNSTLELLIDKSPHKSVRAQATCSLAYALLEESPGAGAARDRAHELLEKVRSDYADTKAAKQAEHGLFELDHLQIGMTVPEIEGTDVDGAAFKISDYRGKVVVLDFWGHW